MLKSYFIVHNMYLLITVYLKDNVMNNKIFKIFFHLRKFYNKKTKKKAQNSFLIEDCSRYFRAEINLFLRSPKEKRYN